MSTYNGRRGPNVSQYLRDLNTISPQDTTPAEETFPGEDDLALFTNTQFFDFDSGQNTDYQAQPVKREGKLPAQSKAASDDVVPGASIIGDVPTGLDFMPGKCYLISYFSTCSSAYGKPRFALGGIAHSSSLPPLHLILSHGVSFSRHGKRMHSSEHPALDPHTFVLVPWSALALVLFLLLG